MRIGMWYAGVVLFMICSCNPQKNKESKESKKDTPAETEVKKPVERKAPAPGTPVASLTLNEEDEVTDNNFTVEIFTTAKPEVFKIDVRYGGNEATDEFTMLPEEYYTKIMLRPGKSDNEIILGFLDKDGKFNVMKSVTASGTHIGIKTLKAYYLSTK